MEKEIIIIGLNPAWQRGLIFKTFKPGGVNRCEKVIEYASGKGINSAISIKKWRGVPILFQFTGGEFGKTLKRDLDEASIQHKSVEVHDSTRMCQTLFINTHSTELIDPSPAITPAEALKLCDKAERFKDQDNYWIFSGTFPSGFTEKHVKKLINGISPAMIILDGIMGVTPILKHGIYILKINRQELFTLTGRKSVNKAWSELRKLYSIEKLIVTDGSNPVTLCSHHKTERYKVPDCENLINPIGSGDAFTGTLAAMLQKGMSLEKIIPLAIGAGVAKCEKLRSVDLSISRAKYYSRKVFKV